MGRGHVQPQHSLAGSRPSSSSTYARHTGSAENWEGGEGDDRDRSRWQPDRWKLLLLVLKAPSTYQRFYPLLVVWLYFTALQQLYSIFILDAGRNHVTTDLRHKRVSSRKRYDHTWDLAPAIVVVVVFFPHQPSTCFKLLYDPFPVSRWLASVF